MMLCSLLDTFSTWRKLVGEADVVCAWMEGVQLVGTMEGQSGVVFVDSGREMQMVSSLSNGVAQGVMAVQMA
jgi:hypothetical protein